MKKKSIIVIGGGAAGLMAAGQAANAGARVLLIESRRSPGRKLSITGKGRCNLTNIAEVPEFVAHFGPNGRFLWQAFARFFSSDLVALLGELGVATETERGGRVFPEGNRAEDVVAALTNWVRDSGVRIITDKPVRDLTIANGACTGVQTADKLEHTADAVILATGGASYPATGSTGDGYRLAGAVGHTVVPIRPALVPIITAGDTARRLQGVSLRNVTARVLLDGKTGPSQFGEMLFTHYGLSGPIILTLSRAIVDALIARRQVSVSIDLKPALDDKKLDARLLRDIESHGRQQFHTLLGSLLPRKLISVCADLTGIDPDKSGHQITAAERKRLRLWLKDFRFVVTGHRSFDEAIITAGGIDTKQIDPRTMESRLIRGLFFAGEVIDVDGDTGGYNLQAAFSTGALAGISAAS